MTPETLQHTRAVRRAANAACLFAVSSFALMWLFNNLLPVVLIEWGVLDASQAYWGLGRWGYELFSTLLYVLTLAPLALLGAALRRPFPFARRANRRCDRRILLPVMLAGLGICIASNAIVNLLHNFIYAFGIETMRDSVTHLSWADFFYTLFASAVLPALLEEMVFRGYMLSLLRPYGQTAALFLTALLFGMMHGGIIQVPFAFIAGLAFGFIALRTGSIWPSVVLHFLNNAYATCTQYGELFAKTETGAAQFSITLQMTLLLLALAAIWFLRTRTDFFAPLPNGPWHTLSAGRRAGLVFSAPVTLLALATFVFYMVYVAVRTWHVVPM